MLSGRGWAAWKHPEGKVLPASCPRTCPDLEGAGGAGGALQQVGEAAPPPPGPDSLLKLCWEAEWRNRPRVSSFWGSPRLGKWARTCVCVCGEGSWGPLCGGSDPGFRPHWLCAPEQACLSSSGSLVVTWVEAAGLVLRAILL